MRYRAATLMALLLAFAAGPAPAAGPAGTTLTMDAPATYSAHSAFTVSGFLVVYAQAPILLEVSRGLAGQTVEVLVDDTVAATAITSGEGYYQVEIALPPTPPTTHTIQAVAFRDGALETRSPSRITNIDRILTSLTINPSSVTVPAGQTTALLAIGEYSDGRTADLTEFASWSSSDAGVAAVSTADGTRGLVTGVTPGNAIVTATMDGINATATVTVT